ncbi:MAG TPA: exosortase/archaeosortase family protein [Verrucomicrobiae bacterium]
MTKNETVKQPPIGGVLWPHEVAFLALLAVAYHYTDAKFRGGGSLPVMLFGAVVIAAFPVLAYRCKDEWQVLPNKGLFFVLAGAWTTLFAFLGNATFGYVQSASLFAWMFDAYTSPLAEEQYGLLLPFVVLVLFWWKRKELVAKPLEFWWPGAILFVGALFLHIIGFIAQQPKLSLIAFIIGIYALTGLAWGKNWLKTSFFPFFLLIFCIPASDSADWLTLRLRLLVSWIVSIIAHCGLAPDLIRDGTQLYDAQHTFAYEVAAACSGIRSLVALLALTSIYGFITFKSPWKRAVMIASALPLAVLGNVARLCFTIMVAETFGQDAGKAVETYAGFVTFAVAIGCVFLISRWLEKTEPQTSSTPEAASL